MAAVVATDEWPRRSLTVAMSTPFSSRRDAWLWRTVWSDAPLGSFSVRQSLETVPDYSRSIPRQTTALANDPSESFPPSCFFVGPLSVWWRVGTLAAASPAAKPTQRSRADAVDELIQQEEEDPVGRVLHSLLPAVSPLTALIPATLRPSDS